MEIYGHYAHNYELNTERHYHNGGLEVKQNYVYVI